MVTNLLAVGPYGYSHASMHIQPDQKTIRALVLWQAGSKGCLPVFRKTQGSFYSTTYLECHSTWFKLSTRESVAGSHHFKVHSVRSNRTITYVFTD